MNRRDFLLLRTDRDRVVEISCQQLYMRYLDTQVTGDRSEGVDDTAADPWSSEPPAVFETRTADQLFRDLECDLRHVDVLRILDSQWLACDELRRELEAVLSSFRRRGGRVEGLH